MSSFSMEEAVFYREVGVFCYPIERGDYQFNLTIWEKTVPEPLDDTKMGRELTLSQLGLPALVRVFSPVIRSLFSCRGKNTLAITFTIITGFLSFQTQSPLNRKSNYIYIGATNNHASFYSYQDLRKPQLILSIAGFTKVHLCKFPKLGLLHKTLNVFQKSNYSK